MLIVMGPVLGVSVADLYAAAFGPGFLLAGLYLAYLMVRAHPRTRSSARRCRWRSASSSLAAAGARGADRRGAAARPDRARRSARSSPGWRRRPRRRGIGALGALLLDARLPQVHARRACSARCSAPWPPRAWCCCWRSPRTSSARCSRAWAPRTGSPNRCSSLPLPPMLMLVLVLVLIFLLGWPFEWPAIILVFLPIFYPVVTAAADAAPAGHRPTCSWSGSARWSP